MFRLFILGIAIAASLCACTKRSSDTELPPYHQPLTADDVAELMRIRHWKFSQLPPSEKPYWGVQIVARRGNGSVIAASSAFDFSTVSAATPEILVGLEESSSELLGSLILKAKNSTGRSTSRFRVPLKNLEMHGGLQYGPGEWRGLTAELLRTEKTEANARVPEMIVTLELLYEPRELSL